MCCEIHGLTHYNLIFKHTFNTCKMSLLAWSRALKHWKARFESANYFERIWVLFSPNWQCWIPMWKCSQRQWFPTWSEHKTILNTNWRWMEIKPLHRAPWTQKHGKHLHLAFLVHPRSIMDRIKVTHAKQAVHRYWSALPPIPGCNFGTQSKEIFWALSLPSLDMTVKAPLPIAMRLSSADKDVTNIDERVDGSISPSSDCTSIPPLNKAIIVAPKTKKRTTSNARGKTIANRTALDVENDYSKEPEMISPIMTSKKVSKHCTSLPL